MNYANIQQWLVEEQAAGYTPDQAVDQVMERIGSRHLREALEAVLRYHSQAISAEVQRRLRRQEEAREAQERVERLLAHACSWCGDRPYPRALEYWVEIGPNLCGHCRMRLREESRKRENADRHRNLRSLNQERSARGLEPLVAVWRGPGGGLFKADPRGSDYRGKDYLVEFVTVRDRQALIDQRKQEQELARRRSELATERNQRRAREHELELVGAARELDISVPSGGVYDLDKTQFELVSKLVSYRKIESAAEEYARSKYGDQVWTGTEWVPIQMATQETFLSSAQWHEAEAERLEEEAREMTEEAKEHRREAELMREAATEVGADRLTMASGIVNAELGPTYGPSVDTR